MTLPVKIHGSNVRDFAMLERNFLTQIRFAIILLLLASSLLLDARLPTPSHPRGEAPPYSPASIPLATLQLVAAVTAIVVGLWEYERGFRDMHNLKAFLTTTRPHTAVMFGVSLIVFASSIALIADASV